MALESRTCRHVFYSVPLARTERNFLFCSSSTDLIRELWARIPMLSHALSQANHKPVEFKNVSSRTSRKQKPQPCCRLHVQTLHVHACCRLHGQENQICSFSSVTISSIKEVPLEKQRSAPGSAGLDLQRSGAPSAPEQNNSQTGFGPNDEEWKRLQRNKLGGECHNNTWGPTQCSDEPITQGLEVCLDKKTPQQ